MTARPQEQGSKHVHGEGNLGRPGHQPPSTLAEIFRPPEAGSDDRPFSVP